MKQNRKTACYFQKINFFSNTLTNSNTAKMRNSKFKIPIQLLHIASYVSGVCYMKRINPSLIVSFIVIIQRLTNFASTICIRKFYFCIALNIFKLQEKSANIVHAK